MFNLTALKINQTRKALRLRRNGTIASPILAVFTAGFLFTF